MYEWFHNQRFHLKSINKVIKVKITRPLTITLNIIGMMKMLLMVVVIIQLVVILPIFPCSQGSRTLKIHAISCPSEAAHIICSLFRVPTLKTSAKCQLLLATILFACVCARARHKIIFFQTFFAILNIQRLSLYSRTKYTSIITESMNITDMKLINRSWLALLKDEPERCVCGFFI